MRRLVLFILILITIPSISTGQVTYNRLEIKLEKDTLQNVPEDKQSTDINGEYVGYILVISQLPDLSFEGSISGNIVIENNEDGLLYYVPVISDTKTLTINHKNYHQTKYNFPPLKGNEMRMIEIIGVEADDANVVEIKDVSNNRNITVNKEYFTDLYIDEILRNGSQFNLEEGSHYLKVKYGDQEFEQKINVDNSTNYFEIHLGGEVIVKNASDVSFRYNNSMCPDPQLEQHSGSTYVYQGMLGDYTLVGKPAGIAIGDVSHNFKVSKRSTKTFYLDQMVNYMFITYHGTHIQPIGASLGFYRKFGFLISYSTHLKDKVNTPYGETDFTYTNNEGEKKKVSRSVSQTLSGGPIFRLWRNLFLHVGAGWAYYLQTSEPGVLTYDYKYKSGLSINGELMFQIRNFIIGAGYTHQFVENAFDKNLSNQIAFSAGFTLPFSAKHAK